MGGRAHSYSAGMRCRWAALLLLIVVVPGCSRLRTTEPLSTASEQFLMTQAINQAIDRLTMSGLRDELVFVDGAYLEIEQKEYLLGELRARLLGSGVRMASTVEQARIILEVRSGGVGIDRYDFLVGIPSLTVPTESGAAAITPELALLKNQRQRGYASVAFVAYFKESGELVAASGPFVGRTLREDYWLFSTTPRTVGNIPTTEERR